MKTLMPRGHPGAITTAPELRPALMDEFISFVDRGEKTTRSYITNLRQFLAWTYYTGARRPTRDDIILYRDYLSAEHDAIRLAPETPERWQYRTDSAGNRYRVQCKPGTVAQYLRTVAQFFKWTAAAGYYPNIAQNIHGPKIRNDAHKKEALAPADVVTIERSIMNTAADRLAAAERAEKDTAGRIGRTEEQNRRLYALYLLAVNAGLRTVELSRAKVRDLEYKNGAAFLYVWGKGHSEPDARKPLAPEVYAAVMEYLRSRSDRPTAGSPLFVPTGNRSRGKPIAPTTISSILKKAMIDAGYNSERITAHSLRHTAGTNLQELTGNIYLTQKYMRHENPRTTEIYLHNKTDRQEEELARRLYSYYHQDDQNDAQGPQKGDRDALQAAIDKMTPEQLTALLQAAEALTGR